MTARANGVVVTRRFAGGLLVAAVLGIGLEVAGPLGPSWVRTLLQGSSASFLLANVGLVWRIASGVHLMTLVPVLFSERPWAVFSARVGIGVCVLLWASLAVTAVVG